MQKQLYHRARPKTQGGWLTREEREWLPLTAVVGLGPILLVAIDVIVKELI